MKKAYLLMFVLLIKISYAATPVVNAIDPIFEYKTKVLELVEKIKLAKTTYEQIQALEGLKKIQAAGEGLCTLCKKSEAKELAQYVKDINGDLCKQFSIMMNNLSDTHKNFDAIHDIIKSFETDPSSASAALLETSVTVLDNIHATLTQMNAMQAQIIQKTLAQEKVNKQSAAEWNSGATHSQK